ncbi:zinc ribbon domain-containing protein [Streptomyces mirabilis]
MTSPTHATPRDLHVQDQHNSVGVGHPPLLGLRPAGGIHRVVYKACRAGVAVVHVDPAYTSRACAECGHIEGEPGPAGLVRVPELRIR